MRSIDIAFEAGGMCDTSIRVRGVYPGGGDSGHGGFVELVVSHNGCADWSVTVDVQDRHLPIGDVQRLRFKVAGDCEVEELTEMLSLVVEALRGFVRGPQ